MSIFPSFAEQVRMIENNKSSSLPMATEIAIDFNSGEPLIVNGDFVKVYGDSAIKVWCYYALKTIKDKFIIYSPSYGSTLEELIGNNYVDNDKYELEKKVSDCLLVSPYIRSVDNVDVEFNSETGELIGDIYITTIYSEGVEVNV